MENKTYDACIGDVGENCQRQWYDLIKFQFYNELPDNFDDCLDEYGEIKEEYQQYFDEVTMFELNHENIRITEYELLEKFLLNIARTPNELDEDIKEAIHQNNDLDFQLGGDGDGLGFILDFFDKEDGQWLDNATFWFEDYDM